MLDSLVLHSAVASRKAYNKVQPHVTQEDFTPDVRFWWAMVEDYYTRDTDACSVDTQLLLAQAELKLSNPKQFKPLADMLTDVPPDLSPDNAVDYLLQVKRQIKQFELAQVLTTPGSAPQKVSDLIQEVTDLLEATTLGVGAGGQEYDMERVEFDWDAIRKETGPENRIKIYPKRLHEAISPYGALRGHHILVFGRQGVGKSDLLITMACGFLKQGLKTLWIENEDPGKDLANKFRRNLASMTQEQVDEFEEDANLRSGRHMDKLVLMKTTAGDRRGIEAMIQEHEPDVVILNQIINMRTGIMAGETTKSLQEAGKQFRSLLDKYNCLGVSCAQAKAVDKNDKPLVWLSYHDVDSSKTGLGASTDVMLGIGASDTMLQQSLRNISVCKNKIDPSKHNGVTLQVDPARSKYK